MKFHATVLIAGITLASLPVSSAACPVCNSDTGRQVRANVFDREFGRNVAAVLAPFPVFLGIVAWIYYGPPSTWAASRAARRQQEPQGDNPLSDRT